MVCSNCFNVKHECSCVGSTWNLVGEPIFGFVVQKHNTELSIAVLLD